MKRTLYSTMALLLVVSLANAQPPRQPGGPDGDFSPPNPFMTVFDADQDGKLSAEEIKGAAEALAKLDRNENGTIEEDELPRMPRGRFGGPGGPGGRGPGNFDLTAQFDDWDADKDGKVTREEMPERMARLFDRFDRDENGSITKTEIEEAMAEFRERFRGRRGGDDGGRRGRRPRGDNDDNNRGERRPARPDA